MGTAPANHYGDRPCEEFLDKLGDRPCEMPCFLWGTSMYCVKGEDEKSLHGGEQGVTADAFFRALRGSWGLKFP